jgi:hypothetical protein
MLSRQSAAIVGGSPHSGVLWRGVKPSAGMVQDGGVNNSRRGRPAKLISKRFILESA